MGGTRRPRPAAASACEHLFVSIKGSPYQNFRRAIEAGNLNVVLGAAAELQTVSLTDALAILALLAQQRPTRYPRAAARWVGRVALERRDITLAELRVVVEVLERLPATPGLERALSGLIER
jgi:hypothetical protein